MNYICNCYKVNFFDKKYSYWEDRNITSDELDVINFISNSKKLNSLLITNTGFVVLII